MLTRKETDGRYTVDVIIPTYRPGAEFVRLIRALREQEYPVHQILIIDTESGVFPDELELTAGEESALSGGDRQYASEIAADAVPEEKQHTSDVPGSGCLNSGTQLQIIRISPEEFDHGGTRMRGAMMSKADIIVFMTQDALPADDQLIGSFVSVFEQYEDVGIAYGRQLPREDGGVIERYTRAFNYPAESRIKSKEDLDELGIKTFFCSDVCAAYRRKYLLVTGGFVSPAIFNEDMIFAGERILAGDRVAYAAQAQVIHSHNYTGRQQFHRNFDLAVSQAQHLDVFGRVSSEGEGIRLVKETAAFLLRQGKPFQVFRLVYQSGCKYIGYFLGKRYQKLPRWLILRCTASRNYWKKLWRKPKMQ